VYPQADGDGGDAFVGAGESERLRLDLSPDLVEVRERLPFAVGEFPVLWKRRKKDRKK